MPELQSAYKGPLKRHYFQRESNHAAMTVKVSRSITTHLPVFPAFKNRAGFF